jgi:hypothetical protein
MVNPSPTALPVGAPPAMRRTRRRRWPWVLAVIVAFLLVALTVVDRIAVSVAQAAVADRLTQQSPFDAGSKPHVSIHGLPFLTQAVAGKYDDIEVSGRPLTIDQVGDIDLDTHMHGVHVPLSKAVGRNVTSLPIDHVDASVVIPYAEVARLTGIPGLSLSGDNGVLHVSLPVNVPGTASSVPASADAVIHLNGRRVSYAVQQISLAGVPVPPAVTSSVAAQMNGAITLPTLPYRLEVTGVTPTASGVQATARADHIVVSTN